MILKPNEKRMALRELRDSTLLNVLSNDSSRRDWAAKDSVSDVQLPPEPDTWSVVSSTEEAVARGGINLVTRVAERLTSPRPSVLQQPTVPTAPAGPTVGPDGPDGEADDELKEVDYYVFSGALFLIQKVKRGGGVFCKAGCNLITAGLMMEREKFVISSCIGILLILVLCL